jgi:hypothetical protein
MGYWWNEHASDLLYRTKSDEYDMGSDYSEEEVRRATVHTREDMILLVSHLSSLNKQLRTNSRISFFNLLALILIALNI